MAKGRRLCRIAASIRKRYSWSSLLPLLLELDADFGGPGHGILTPVRPPKTYRSFSSLSDRATLGRMLSGTNRYSSSVHADI